MCLGRAAARDQLSEQQRPHYHLRALARHGMPVRQRAHRSKAHLGRRRPGATRRGSSGKGGLARARRGEDGRAEGSQRTRRSQVSLRLLASVMLWPRLPITTWASPVPPCRVSRPTRWMALVGGRRFGGRCCSGYAVREVNLDTSSSSCFEMAVNGGGGGIKGRRNTRVISSKKKLSMGIMA